MRWTFLCVFCRPCGKIRTRLPCACFAAPAVKGTHCFPLHILPPLRQNVHTPKALFGGLGRQTGLSQNTSVMKEITDIITAYEQAVVEKKRTALATVVQVEGSSYRRAGARMLITEDGRLTGAISGGCLEGDAMRKALHVINEQRPMLVTYDTMDEDDATLGVGLGCQGIIQVLIEPVLPADPLNPLALLRQAAARRQPGLLATVFSLKNRRQAQPGTRLYVGADGQTLGGFPLPGLEGRWQADSQLLLQQRSSQWVAHEEGGESYLIFYDYLLPSVSLVVLGAGNDVMPLADMADQLGWEVRVLDGRANYARPDRFASACQVLVAKPEEVLQRVPVDEWTVFALMTHNYNYDKAALHALCRRQVRYVAMLGPKKKIARMLQEFEEEGRPLSEAELSIIHSPAGLDIGAETSAEIALSILAEIKAFLSGRRLHSLRDKVTAIHAV